MTRPAPLDPEKLIRTLTAKQVRFVLIGALAARLQGFPRVSADADITPARDPDNLKRLAQALRQLRARVFTEAVPEGLPFDFTPKALSGADLWNLVTTAGRLDIVFTPAGTSGYEDLVQGALQFEVYGSVIFAASLEDILRTKEAAGRPQDRQDALLIRKMLRRSGR